MGDIKNYERIHYTPARASGKMLNADGSEWIHPAKRVTRPRPKHYVEVDGFGLGDSVRVTSEREGVTGLVGVLTGIANGKRLAPYFRVRLHIGRSTSSPWFTRGELARVDAGIWHPRTPAPANADGGSNG